MRVLMCAACVSLMVLTLTACDFGIKKSSALDVASTQDLAKQQLPLAKSQPFDIGDVEYAIAIEGMLDFESQSANVSQEMMRDMKKQLNLDTITVTPPPPSALWVAFDVRSSSNFPKASVLVKAQVMVDGKPVDAFHTVFGPDARGASYVHKFDVLKGRDGVPETLLANVQAEVMLLPEDTDPATVDPATITPPDEEVGHVLSNPVRVNFTPKADG